MNEMRDLERGERFSDPGRSEERIHDATHKKSWRGAWRSLSKFQKLVTIIVIAIFLFVFYVTLDANKYRSYVLIVEGEGIVGVNPTTEALDFGDLSRGGKAVRTVRIENDTALSMYIAIFKTGRIGDITDISRNNFTLPPRGTAEIEFETYIPASAKVGERYAGRVYLFKIPFISFGS